MCCHYQPSFDINQIDKSVQPVCRGVNFRVDMETVEMVPNVIDEKYRVAKFDVKK